MSIYIESAATLLLCFVFLALWDIARELKRGVELFGDFYTTFFEATNGGDGFNR